jgi:hypothetical protein
MRARCSLQHSHSSPAAVLARENPFAAKVNPGLAWGAASVRAPSCSTWLTDSTKPKFSFASVSNLNWMTRYGAASNLDVQIVPDVLFCKGTQCTTDPIQ